MRAQKGLLIGVVAFAGCAASPGLGFDPATHTYASTMQLEHKAQGYKITCERDSEHCIRRAEAICAKRYKIVGRPSLSPRAQVIVDMKIATVNADNPHEILIACDRLAFLRAQKEASHDLQEMFAADGLMVVGV